MQDNPNLKRPSNKTHLPSKNVYIKIQNDPSNKMPAEKKKITIDFV
jgi:hypothetical protein